MPFKRTRRSRRLRNNPKEGKEASFFSTANDPGHIQSKGEVEFFQKKSEGIGIGPKGDQYEQEADAVADAVVDQSGNPPAVQQKKTVLFNGLRWRPR